MFWYNNIIVIEDYNWLDTFGQSQYHSLGRKEETRHIGLDISRMALPISIVYLISDADNEANLVVDPNFAGQKFLQGTGLIDRKQL